VKNNNHVTPSRSFLLRQQDATIRDGIDRIAKVAVFAADPIQIITEMAIFCKRLRIVGHCAVFTSQRKIEARGGWQRRQIHCRHKAKRGIMRCRPAQFRPKPQEKRRDQSDQKKTGQQRDERESGSSLARVALHLYARAMRILVTGGAGFIGSHLAEKLLAAGHNVSILDDFNDFYDPQIKRANIREIEDQIAVHQIDLRDGGAVRTLFHREKFDAIAHLAARAGVRPSIQQPQLYYDTNVIGTLHLLQAACSIGIDRFIFASSSSVYGVSKTVPFSEDLHLTQTLSPYAATKIASEFLCSTYSHLYQLRLVALRFFTVYGPRQRPDLAIHQFTRRIQAGEAIDQFGDGTTRRDYTYIDDIIQGVIASLSYEGPLFDIFNLGESETVQLKDLIAAIENAVARKAKINRLPEQAGDMPLTCADISKARKLLGYNPTTSLSTGLPIFVEWFLKSSRA
jgi:UDP-glucuronate 4-epimerase